ncbi:hypothetical protein C3L33_08740, partial [Rhododendron williamsianum]
MERLAQNGRYLVFSLVGAEIFTDLEVLEREKEQRQGDGKPQQQRRRQQKKKIKKKMLNPVRVNTLTGRDRCVRDFTPEEREVYNKRVRESEGFDVGEIPDEVILNLVIREIPLDPRCSIIVYSTTSANTALRDYNKDNAEQNGITRNFQARVREFLGMHIEFCREEKKPNLTEEYAMGLNRSRTCNGAFRLDRGVLGNRLVQGRHLSSREMLKLVLFLLWLGKYL